MDLTSPIKRHGLANWIKKEDPMVAYGERLEEYLPSQWPLKTGRVSNTYLGQSKHQTYIDQMR
jgi:hypothetical protein